MTPANRKFGWTALGLAGWVFLPIGLIFLIVGVLLWHFDVGEQPGDSQIFLYVFGGMGSLFVLLGTAFLYADIRRRKGAQAALDGGKYVMAKVVGTTQMKNVNMGTRYPFVLECHYTDPATGVLHVYTSRYLYYNPAELIGQEIKVYIDDYNEKNYFVDVDELLPGKVVYH